MNRTLAVILAAMLAVLGAGTALAQEAPAADNPEPSAYLTMDVNAGFVLDPFIVSVNGGGEVDASTLDPACSGFINDKPVLLVNWTGKAEHVNVFYYSDADPTLVIEKPDGTYVCADDANDNVLDPELTIDNPPDGQYKIWVGNYDAAQLIPGLLVISAKEEVTLSNIDLGNLVKRPALPKEDVRPPDVPEVVAAEEIVSGTLKITVDGQFTAGEPALSAQIVSTGTEPAMQFSQIDETAVCSGLVSEKPDYIFHLHGSPENLHIFFESDQDASLVVLGKSGVYCNDESAAGANANPQVDLANPEEGIYAVWVGVFGDDTEVTGTLTITDAATDQPDTLAPAPTPTTEP